MILKELGITAVVLVTTETNQQFPVLNSKIVRLVASLNALYYLGAAG